MLFSHVHKCSGFQSAIWGCLLVALLCSAFLVQSVAQTDGDSTFKPFIAEIKRGQIFHRSLAPQISFEVKPLDPKHDGRIGVYISVLNSRNPKGYKFVVLPKVDSGGDANWVGIDVSRTKERPSADSLRSALDHYSGIGLCVTYFTDNLSRSELENVRGAWAMLHRHGGKEEEYQQANDVLNSLHRVGGLFSVLEYKIADNPLRIEYLKFSFDPCDPQTCDE
jgi:hypothetical protein